MSSRQFASLEPEERKQVIEGIYQQLTPQIEAAINQYLSTVTPSIRQTVRDEMGKWAVTEKQAGAFLDGMILEAATKASAFFRPRWLMRLFFRGRVK